MDDVIGFVLNGEQHSLSRAQVLSAAARGEPEPIRTHWVSVGDQRWPPRQLFERALGVSRTEFISHTAIRQLRRLGFPTSPLPQETEAQPAPEPSVGLDAAGLGQAFADLVGFLGAENLTDRVGRMEQHLYGADLGNVGDRDGGMTDELLKAALLVRERAGRVNDLIHAAMIVRALPKILEPGERITCRPSLASGNDPSRKFDLETDRRVAEFKAASWKGRDTMRKRMLVADLVGLVLGRGRLRAELYVLGPLPINFLRTSNSPVEWMLGRSSPNLRRSYAQRFGSAELTVSQFTTGPAADVALVDLAGLLELA
ncbi:PE-PGRS family protein [Streptomyces sp. MN03-5084-2B]|nr:PE-PGRS family protein [Streptomyces sp. MN03-5084-2B]